MQNIVHAHNEPVPGKVLHVEQQAVLLVAMETMLADALDFSKRQKEIQRLHFSIHECS